MNHRFVCEEKQAKDRVNKRDEGGMREDGMIDDGMRDESEREG